MREPAHSPRVRPAFVKGSIAAVAVLLPFLLVAGWDYIEMRRLRAEFQRITIAGEPLTTSGKGRGPLYEGSEYQAARFYRAAAALASENDSDVEQNIMQKVQIASRDRNWPPTLVKELETYVGRYEDVFRLVDGAGNLSFEGFQPGTLYNYRTAELWRVSRLCGLRAVARAHSGRGSEAIDSLYSQVRLGRVEDAVFWQLGASRAFVTLRDVVEGAPASKASLARLAKALVEAEATGRQLRPKYVSVRASIIGGSGLSPFLPTPSGWQAFFGQPLAAHRLNSDLRSLREVINAADGSWPGQLDQVRTAISRYGGPGVIGSSNTGPALAGWVNEIAASSASVIARLNVMRVAVAIELYRRDHEELLPAGIADLVPDYLETAPLDPFTGGAIVLKLSDNGYSAYSVGPDRRDNGGDVTTPEKTVKVPYPESSDIGLDIVVRLP